MTHQVSQTTSDLASNAMLCSMLLAAAVSGDTTYPVKEHSPPNIQAIALELDELNQVEMLSDAPTEATTVTLFDGSLPNTLQETHATSMDIQKQIMAGIDRQLLLADEEEREVTISKPSKSGLFSFAKMQKITTPPFVVLQDNGNLSASWMFDNGEEFNLTFLRNGTLNYVAFLNRTGTTKTTEAILHGNDIIEGVMGFIQSNKIIL